MLELPERVLLSALVAALLLPACASAGPGTASAAAEGKPGPEAVTADYWVYVGAESDDLLHRVRFGPEGARVVRTIPVGVNPTETEGPHGLAITPDGRHLFMTTGHGTPDGMLWKYELGPDTLVAGPILLGRFPASLDITSDGLFVFVANFNLYGEHKPSTMSAAYAPSLYEIEQIELCVMPHGARSSPSGNRVYTVCMMDDQLVEVDTRRYEVARRFSVAEGREGPLPAHAVAEGEGEVHARHEAARADRAEHADPGARSERGDSHGDVSCSPTWAQPSVDGSIVWVACNASDVLLEVDVPEWKLRRVIPTGRGPYNLDVTPDGRLIVATLKQGRGVEFFDAETGASLARAETSTTVVHGVAISPDSRYAFVSVEGVGSEPGKVDVFDLRSFERIADVPVGRQASGIAFWKMEDR